MRKNDRVANCRVASVFRAEMLEPRRLLTVLAFEGLNEDASSIPSDYGQHVSDAFNDGYVYIQNGEGFTPDVAVDFINGDGSVNSFTNGFGNLRAVAYPDHNGDGILRIIFTSTDSSTDVVVTS